MTFASGVPFSGGVPFGAEAGAVGAFFSASPSSTHTLGIQTFSLTGFGTDWISGSRNISVSSGPATVSGSTNNFSSDTAGTVNLNVSALSGTIVISDGVLSANISAAVIAPNAPTSVVLTDNHDGTVTAAYTQSSDSGGSAITGNSLLTSVGQTASATSPGSPIVFSPTNGVAITAQVRSTNSAGNSAYSSASNSITPNNQSSINILVRAPYLSTDTIGTKSVQVYDIESGVLTAVGSAQTSGFSAVPNIANGWNVTIPVVPNGDHGDFAGIAVFSNINGTSKAAVELYSPPTSAPAILVQCKIAPFSSLDTIGTPGYRLYDSVGSAIGAHETSGILAITGITNGYVTKLTLTPDGALGFQGSIVWDG